MTERRRRPSFPLPPLLAAGSLVGFTIAVALAGRVAGAAAPQPTSAPLVERDLRFADQADGGLAAFDAHGGQVVTILQPGTNGFIRATLRGLGRARRLEGIGPDAPFHLTAWKDGRLTLDDPTTGRRVDLEAFGITNETAFARLLPETNATASRSAAP